jgi:RNA polymerase sigma-70 factor, ECF subfamily
VSTVRREDQVEREGANLTLGDVLYSDKASPPQPETAWASSVRAIAAGDQSALYSLYQRTHRIVFTLIMRIVKDAQSAEELTVDVFHDVWRRASEYDPADGPVLGWILNQARCRAIDRLRLQRRKKRVNPFSSDGVAGEFATGCEDVVEAQERGRLLHDALAALTHSERAAIESAFFGELSYAEVALRAQEPVGTIKTRIRSALHKLRRVLASGDVARE